MTSGVPCGWPSASSPARCQELLRIIAFAPRPDYAAVAAALGMPIGSIGPTRGRCLAKLRALLAADPGGESAVTPSDAGGMPSADEPLDDVDLGLLDDIRELFQAADPMPAGSSGADPLLPRAARSGDRGGPARRGGPAAAAARGAEQSRTITFDSDSLTIMIRIDANRDGTVRVDGWLAPPQRREIEMKTAADSLTVASDEQGRFAFARVPRGNGPARGPARRAGPSGAGRSVVTPALIL